MEEQGIIKQEESQEIAASGSVKSFADMFTTCDLNDRKGKNAVLRALNDADSLAEAFPGDAVLEVTDFVVKPGVRRSRVQGQADMPCLNVYILTNDGNAYMTQSDGIANSVQDIVSMYPEGMRANEDGFTRCQLTAKKLPNGNTLKKLYPLD